MTLRDIEESFDGAFPEEALSEVLRVASELADSFHVAAFPSSRVEPRNGSWILGKCPAPDENRGIPNAFVVKYFRLMLPDFSISVFGLI